MTLLDARDLVVGYGATDEIIKGVSLHVEDREIVAIIGPNGAGKSTLLKSLAGALQARTGTILFDGRDLSQASARRRSAAGLAYVAQEANIFGALSVKENLEIGGHLLSPGRRRAKLAEIIGRFPVLGARLKFTAGLLSGGQRQMLAVAAALMAEPRLILLDEPSAGLSPVATQDLFAMLVAVRELGVALLMIEQNAMDALAISDRAYVIVLGRNMRDGDARGIADDPSIRKTFLGL